MPNRSVGLLLGYQLVCCICRILVLASCFIERTNERVIERCPVVSSTHTLVCIVTHSKVEPRFVKACRKRRVRNLPRCLRAELLNRRDHGPMIPGRSSAVHCRDHELMIPESSSCTQSNYHLRLDVRFCRSYGAFKSPTSLTTPHCKGPMYILGVGE